LKALVGNGECGEEYMTMSELKELAKVLCNESGCHHKCPDTTDCVVEDEAELLINGNKTIPKMFTVDVCNNCALLLINQNKSNNFEVKSNNELFKQALVEGGNRCIDKTIEEEQQIEEMRAILCRSGAINHCEYCEDCEGIVEALYNAGYRKQSEGEWNDNIIGFCNV
jgi:hypothetical protein